MKNNKLSLIGSIIGCCSIFFIGEPLCIITTTYSGWYNPTTTKEEILVNSLLDPSNNHLINILFTATFIVLFACLIIAITGMIEKKNYSSKIFALSMVNVCTFYTLISNFKDVDESITLGWGIIIILVLIGLSILFDFIGYLKYLISLSKINNMNPTVQKIESTNYVESSNYENYSR